MVNEFFTNMFADECISFSTDWLRLKDYELKVLISVSVLSDKKSDFIGTLKSICEWLEIKPTTVNNYNIKQAIDSLSANGYINYKKIGRNYSISIIKKERLYCSIVGIRKCWITSLKNYKQQVEDISISWINLLKVFVYIYYFEGGCFTQLEAGDYLNISRGTVGKALKILNKLKLNGIEMKKSIVKERVDENTVYTIGTMMTIYIIYDDFK